jgi:hypothetical protein
MEAEQMRKAVAAERTVVAELLAKVTDPQIRQHMLNSATHSLDDVEAMLGYAANSNPVMWLAGAGYFLHIAQLQRQAVQDIVAKYGPDAMLVGG